MALDGALHYQGKNFAPVAPLQHAKRSIKDTKDNPSSLNAFFREQYEQISQDYDPQFTQVIKQAQVIQNMVSGKMIMKRDMAGTGYVFLDRIVNARQSDRSNFPIFPQNYETLKSKLMRSRPMMQGQAFGDGYRVEEALNGIDLIVKHYFRKIFDGAENMYEAAEAESALDYGTYITQFFYDDRLNQIRQAIPIIQNESQVVVPGYGACHNCGYEGHPDDFAKTQAPYPQCPECESFKTTKMVPDAMEEMPTIIGADEIVQGDISGRLLNFGACRFDPHDYAHNSDYFLYSEYISLRQSRILFGQDLDLSPSESTDIGLQFLDAMAARGGNIEGLGENDYYGSFSMLKERVPIRWMYLKPERYMGLRLKTPEKTLAGTIPADVPLEEIFPEGVCVGGVEDFRLQPVLVAEKANIASACYITQSHSGIGKAASDGVDIAKDINEMHSMRMAGIKRYGASGIVVDSSSGLTQENIRNLFKVNKAVFADLKGSGIDDIRKAVTQLTLNPVNPVLTEGIIQGTNLLNMVMMTNEFTQGMVQDVDINTLGGQQLAHARMEESKGAILTGQVFHRKQSAKIITELFRKHIKLPKFYTHGEDKQGSARGKYITGVDLPQEIDFVAVPESEIPVNRAEKQMAIRELVEKSGGIAQLVQAAQIAPKETAWFMEQYNVKLPTLDTNELKLVCLSRVDEIKELANIYQDPTQILLSLRKKVKVDETLHVLKAEFVSSMLDDDEADDWSPVVMETVQFLIDLHYDYAAEQEAKKQIIMSNAQSKVQMTMMQNDRAIMQPMIQEQQDQEMANQIVSGLGEVANKVIDDEAKQAEFERGEEAADNQMVRDEMSNQASDSRKASLEMSKAKAASAKTKK